MSSFLYSVHEALLGAVEEEDSEEHHDDESEGAIEHTPGIESADTEAGVLERLKDGGEGVDIEEQPVLLGSKGKGIDDWRGIHQELNTEGDEHVEVTVLGGERRDDESPRHGMEPYHGNEDGKEKKRPRQRHLELARNYEVNIDEDEHKELYAEAYQIAGDARQWYYETREIDLAKDCLVGGKDIAACREALLEVTPHADACHIEKGLGHTIGGDACQSAKDKHIHDSGEQWLDEIPQRTENGLLVLRDDVALDVHTIESLVAHKALEVNIEPLLLGLDMGNLFLGIHI